MFQVTKEARAEVMYMLSEDGLLVATDGMKKDIKQCPNNTQIPVDDYCVQPICGTKDIRPAIKPPPSSNG